ncbi:MAG: LpxL/LpxP family Kdo(2)-lipid IV(A) lauroyl/palmitoleoyl acyltransferase [Wenzhouxiangellaceae bacterium]
MIRKLAHGFAAIGAAITILVIELIARLPLAWARPLANAIGSLMRLLLRQRRRIAAANLQRCFSNWPPARREAVLKQHFRSLGMMLVETAWAWSGRSSQKLPPHRFSGLQQLLQLQAEGRGVLLVTGHFTCMDIGGRFLCEAAAIKAVYRPLRNPALERYQTRGRLRHARGMISKYDSGAVLRALRQGETIWYAPDQDFGPRRSLFVPFFDQPTATLKATWTLARRSQAVVLTMFPRRLDDGSYLIEIGNPLECTADAGMFLTELNRRIEAAVRHAPEQYWWVHRRFKSQPPSASAQSRRRSAADDPAAASSTSSASAATSSPGER